MKKKTNTKTICLSNVFSSPSRISMKDGEIVVTKTGERAVFPSKFFPDGTPVIVVSRDDFAKFLDRVVYGE